MRQPVPLRSVGTGFDAAPPASGFTYGGQLNLGVALVWVVAVLILTLPPTILFLAGIEYAKPIGSPLTKIHAASYVAISIALMLVASYLIDLRKLLLTRVQLFNLAFFMCILVIVMRNAVLQTQPMSLLIDTFLLPAALILILDHLGRPVIPGLATMLHVFFFLNSAIGIVEFITERKLGLIFPWLLTPDAYLIFLDWRSYSLLGHPLTSAMATGVYVTALAALSFGGRRTLAVYTIPIHLVAMLTFGARAGAVSLFLVLGLMGLIAFIRALYTGRVPRSAALFLAFGVIAIPVIVGLFFATDIFDPFIGRFTDDNGSALARVLIFSVLQNVSWSDLFFGTDAETIRFIQARIGLDFGVEVFWIAMVLMYGAVVMIPFFALFLGRLYLDVQGTYMAFVPIFLLMSATASLSLSGKTLVYALYVLVMHAFREVRPVPQVPVLEAPR